MSLVNEVSSKYLTGRIKRFGVQSLSDKELLYYLLNVKMQSKKASEACNAFFKDFSGLFQIKDFVPENWELLLGGYLRIFQKNEMSVQIAFGTVLFKFSGRKIHD